MRSKIHAIPRQKASAPADYAFPNYESDREPVEPPDILSGQQAAKYLGVCYRTFTKLLRAWEIPHRRLGRRVIVSKNAIIQAVEKGLHAGAGMREGERG